MSELSASEPSSPGVDFDRSYLDLGMGIGRKRTVLERRATTATPLVE